MRSCVQDHLTDSSFAPAVLARRHGISARNAADLFAEAGTSPATYIRDQQLKAAHRVLADPRQSHRTIARIAAQLGFTDRTTFTRAFVRQYGMARRPVESMGSDLTASGHAEATPIKGRHGASPSMVTEVVR